MAFPFSSPSYRSRTFQHELSSATTRLNHDQSPVRVRGALSSSSLIMDSWVVGFFAESDEESDDKVSWRLCDQGIFPGVSVSMRSACI